jgi:pyrimidine operon attenuation protein/uracil phosphoribosyltransferase
MGTTKNYILSKEAAEKKLRRMALEVTERNFGELQLILAGIKENGVIIANKVAAYLAEVFKGEIIVTELSIDKKQPGLVTLHPNIDFTNKTVLLIDDVANSGKVMLYALQPLLAGYPKSIQTLALVERTHKNFPLALDYVGMSYSTKLDEHINVEVEDGQVLGAWM